ncbi:hypothetical protein MANES_11G059336v8 [Manihot esculenta]|uniref:Uncharacterized protein n=3 Tax=Manihot esculenta TaxID=3983 RepID=A0ACB7GUK6_MANES|nr:hypothetical protein MANES_11G059336v8 [Manihot esculenta]
MGLTQTIFFLHGLMIQLAIVVNGSVSCATQLQQLKELKTLNLSYNYFDCSIDDQGCERLSKLKKLEVLDLTWNRFNNIFLPSLGALISLKTLIFGYNIMESSFPIQVLNLRGNQFSGPLPECIGNLTNLQFLDLSFNQLSGNIQSIVSELTSLKYLLLSGNEFEGSFSFSALANHSKLELFILSPGSSRLELETENPTWFPAFQLKNIQLSNCNLNVRTRAIPSFLRYQHDIRFIDLSHNTLVGTFPTWILQNNSKLVVMNLRNNSFTGTFQLPNFKHDLVQLDISSNNLTGMLPKEFGLVRPRLEYINMSRNNFGGNVPSSISETPTLSTLDLFHNNFSGELPGSLFANCTMFCALILSNNNFQGNVLPQDMDLRSMRVLDMKNNNFSAMVGADLLNSRSLSSLNFFDISNNKVSGPIPRLLCNLTDLVFLDLSKNRLYGSRPSCFNSSYLHFLFLQKNNLSGPIPHELLRSPNLVALDLRDNNFSGNIPSWIGQFSELQVLSLGGNALHGRIPNQLCELRNANIMDLSRNLLFGSVPACFSNISFGNDISFEMIEVVDIPNFMIIYLNNPDQIALNLHLPWVDWDYSELVEVEFATKYRYNSYKGDIINSMAGIDLSCNELSGSIPQEIGDLHEIRSLNLSHNHITGSIPVGFSNLRSLESLDLGNNNLSGEIPNELVALTFLGTFNVSYNNLSGRVPNGAQFATFDENNYRGNPGLCGEPIHKTCGFIGALTSYII